MTDQTTGNEARKPFGSFLTASVALALYILYFEVITISRSMAFAFNIPNQYVGIYFSKLFGFYDFSTTIGSIIDITIYYIVGVICPDNGQSGKDKTKDTVRKGISVSFLFWIFICRTLFVIILYKSRSMSYHFYILFSVEAFFFGFAQISYFAYAGEFSSANTLAINCSALLAFLVQTILDWVIPSNPLKMLRIHSFICFGITLFSLVTWPYFLFWFDSCFPKGQQSASDSAASSSSSTSSSTSSSSQHQCSVQVPSTRSVAVSSSLLGFRSDVVSQSSIVDRSSLLYIDELTIIRHIVRELKDICSCSTHIGSTIGTRAFISILEGISSINQINYELLVTLDLIIVGIQRSDPSQNCMLLKQLVLFLRIRIQMNLSSRTLTQTTSIALGSSQLTVTCTGNEPEQQQQESQVPEEQTQNGQQCSEGALQHFGKSMSRFLSFHIPSLFKDFLFPAILPYGLLEVNKCKIINMLVPIFTVLGSLTNFVWTEIDKDRNKNWNNNKNYDYVWVVLIPIIIVYICSLLAIHSNIRFFRGIVNSQWRVIIMMFPLLYFYEFMVNVSYSGVADYVFGCKGDDKPKYVLETHNLSCMLFPYLFCKISVGYNDVRIKSGYVLPNFRPVPGLKNTFCYWFCNIFKHAWYDIVNDFKFDIKKYL